MASDAPPEGRKGRFIVVGGPDGVGKTTLAGSLAASFAGPTAYFHFRPLVWSPLLESPPLGNPPNPDKGRARGPAPIGWLRLARNFVRLWTGYLVRVRPAVRRGALVIGDRWAFGYLAQPRALKYYGPDWMARLAIRLLPQPDLLVNLVAPPEVIRSRKAELSLEEIRAELRRWEEIPTPRLTTIEALSSPDEMASVLLAEIAR